MKRSEMLEKLREKFTLMAAEEMLSIVESVGMLPPLREKIENDRFVGFSSTLYPEWEQE